MVAGEGRQVVDVHMDVDEAALHLYHTVVSLLCILLVIEEEEASCLGKNTSLSALNPSLGMNGVILGE